MSPDSKEGELAVLLEDATIPLIETSYASLPETKEQPSSPTSPTTVESKTSNKTKRKIVWVNFSLAAFLAGIVYSTLFYINLQDIDSALARSLLEVVFYAIIIFSGLVILTFCLFNLVDDLSLTYFMYYIAIAVILSIAFLVLSVIIILDTVEITTSLYLSLFLLVLSEFLLLIAVADIYSAPIKFKEKYIKKDCYNKVKKFIAFEIEDIQDVSARKFRLLFYYGGLFVYEIYRILYNLSTQSVESDFGASYVFIISALVYYILSGCYLIDLKVRTKSEKRNLRIASFLFTSRFIVSNSAFVISIFSTFQDGRENGWKQILSISANVILYFFLFIADNLTVVFSTIYKNEASF